MGREKTDSMNAEAGDTKPDTMTDKAKKFAETIENWVMPSKKSTIDTVQQTGKNTAQAINDQTK